MARVPVNIVDKNIENMVVQAAVGATVEVTIQREAPQGANGSAVNLPALPMGLQPLDGSAVLRPDRGNGKAVIKDVAPGPYALDWSLGGEYVKRVRYDNQDVTDKPIVVGTTGGKLEIELGTDAGSAAGTVRDEKGTAVGGLSVTVWSASAAREGALLFSRTANALPTGMARVAGLRPGEYFIVAWEKIDTQSGINSAPEFLKQFESKATRVKIEPKAQLQNLDFKIIPVKDIEAAIARLP
jgi:hypothetical protein